MRKWVLTVAVVFLALLGGVVYPMHKQNKVLDTEYETLVKSLEEKTSVLQALAAEDESSLEEGEELRKSIPKVLSQPEIIRDIRLIATANQFSFPSLQFSKAVQTDSSAPQLNVQLNVEGPAENLINFLSAIERNDPFLALNDLNVSLEENDRIRLGLQLYTLALQDSN